MNLYPLPAHELGRLIQDREISIQELTSSVFQRIEEVEDKIKAFLSLNRKGALEEAGRLDRRLSKGEKLGLLGGIPIAVKDNICLKDQRTTCGSRILENFCPPYSATVAQRLKEADAVIIGKTNMDEFAMGSSTENSAFQVTHNPWNLKATPGGSSGGSAAAVASGEAVMALGSDTGGSIRQPASFCGVVGLKATYGRVSRYGLVAFASSLDQIGPITRDVLDCAMLLEVLSGRDRLDSTSLGYPVPSYVKHCIPDLKNMTIGLPREYFVPGMSHEVREAIIQATGILEKLGAKIEEVSLPHTEYAIATYYLIATAEASSNLARYDGVGYGLRTKDVSDLIGMYKKSRQEGFGEEVKRRIMLGTYVLSKGYYDDYYGKAGRVRTLVRRDFEEVFKKCDAVVTPTSPTVAFEIGEKVDDPVKMYLSDIFTISANLAGIPGISIPCGYSPQGLPIGLQVLAKAFDEPTLLRVAYAFEQNTDWHKREPEIDLQR